MSSDDRLPAGLYERIVTERLDVWLASSGEADIRGLSKSEAARALGRYLGDLIARGLESLPEDVRPYEQIVVANRVIDALVSSLSSFADAGDRVQPRVLRAIAAPGRPTPDPPELPLSESGLYVNARRERRLGTALQKEIVSADRVDLVCAFLVWEGYRELRDRLLAHRDAGRQLRVLTTTYRGVTQARVLEDLLEHGANVKVSYRADATRLHAKAWLFHRDSGFSTAYVGSSNLSRTALVSGLEWNVRLSAIENPGVLEELRGAFEAYYADPEFEDYEPERFAREVKAERPDRTVHAVFEMRARPFQQRILDMLEAERALHDRHANLVVAATGTGKTVIAALDYQWLCRQAGRRLRLLFVAHRREILRQSLDTFRHAMSDPAFGERWVDGQRPVDGTHVFASVQSLAQIDVREWKADRYEVVIIDEFHHAAGKTYRDILGHLRPTELLGLTATPERPDSAPILEWFGGRIAAEVRLWDAIDLGLLVPFHYYAVHDVASLEGVTWSRRGFDVRELEGLYTGHHARAHLIVQAVREHVGDPARMRALVFCVGVRHAAFMADAFTRAGLASVAIDKDTPKAARDATLQGLATATCDVCAASTCSTKASTSRRSTPSCSCVRPSRRSCSSSSWAAGSVVILGSDV